jgi:hypothetical protein
MLILEFTFECIVFYVERAAGHKDLHVQNAQSLNEYSINSHMFSNLITLHFCCSHRNTLLIVALNQPYP